MKTSKVKVNQHQSSQQNRRKRKILNVIIYISEIKILGIYNEERRIKVEVDRRRHSWLGNFII